MTPLGFVRRELRHEWAATAVIALLVLVSTMLVVALPRAQVAAYDDALRTLVTSAPAEARLVEARGSRRQPYADVGALDSAVAEARTGLGVRHQQVLDAGSWSVGVPDLAMTDPTGEPRAPARLLGLRVLSGWEDEVRLVAGRLPAGVDRAVPPPAFASTVPAPVIEVVMTPLVADDLDVALDDVVFLRDPTAPPLGVRLTGLVEPRDTEAVFWTGQARVLDAALEPEGQGSVYRGSAVAPEEAYDVIASLAQLGLDTRLRYAVASPGDLTDDDVTVLRTEYATAQATGVPGGVQLSGFLADQSTLLLVSGLAPLLDTHAAQRAASSVLSTIEAVSLLVLAGLLLWSTARVVGRRRAAVWRLLTARGAGRGQVTGALAAEQTAVAVPAAAVGAIVGILVTPGRGSATSWLLALVVLVAAIWSLPSVGLSSLRPVTRSAQSTRRLTARLGGRARRSWLGTAVVVLAVAAVLSLQRRGVSATTDGTVDDPLLASAPTLLGLACGVVALSVLPTALRVLASALRGRQDAVPYLAATASARTVRVRALPLLAVMLAATSATFLTVVVGTIDRGRSVAAWYSVGGDVTVRGVTFLPDRLAALESVPGVERALGVLVVSGAVGSEGAVGGSSRPVEVVVVDTAAATAAFADAPVDTELPEALRSSLAVGAVVAGGVLDGLDSPVVAVEGADLQVSEVGRIDGFPGVGRDRALLVVDRSVAEAATGRTFVPNEVRLFGPTLRVADVQDAAAGLGLTVEVQDRATAADSSTTTPLLNRTVDLARAGVVACMVAGALAALLAVVATGRDRALLGSLLATLGMGRHERRRLDLAELVPLVVVAALLGTAVGVAVALVIGGSLDLAPFVGTRQGALPVAVDPLAITLTAAVVTVVVVAAALPGALVASRRTLVPVLRAGLVTEEST